MAYRRASLIKHQVIFTHFKITCVMFCYILFSVLLEFMQCWLCKTARCRLGFVYIILKIQGFITRKQVTGELVSGKNVTALEEKKHWVHYHIIPNVILVKNYVSPISNLLEQRILIFSSQNYYKYWGKCISIIVLDALYNTKMSNITMRKRQFLFQDVVTWKISGLQWMGSHSCIRLVLHWHSGMLKNKI